MKINIKGIKKSNSRSSLFNNNSLRQFSDLKDLKELKDLNTDNTNSNLILDKKNEEINKNTNKANISKTRNTKTNLENKTETNYLLTSQSNFGGQTNKTNYLLTQSAFADQSSRNSNLISQNDLFNSHNNTAMFNNLGSDTIQTNQTNNFANNLNSRNFNTNNSFLRPSLLLDDKLIKEIEEELTKQTKDEQKHNEFNLPDLINSSNLLISNFISEFDDGGSDNVYDSKKNFNFNNQSNNSISNNNLNLPSINMIDLKELNLNVSTENSKLSLNKSHQTTSSLFETNILNHNIKNKVLDESFESNMKY